jgi:exo-beta-1,3-glucanase (GH17 family)
LHDETLHLLQAISELKAEDPEFEMYMMLGAWMQCENAFSDTPPNHAIPDSLNNKAEIDKAVELLKQYPDIVKIIAVGNESMVHWAASYFVAPAEILKWVNHLQGLKTSGEIPAETWITSSDNFASWGGESVSYHTEDLAKLVKAVDYVSMHTYPFHDTHYNNTFWLVPEDEEDLSVKEQADLAMQRALELSKSQHKAVSDYIKSLGVNKPIHIGETGWSTLAAELFHPEGSRAADEYKQKVNFDLMRDWAQSEGMSLFYFEAFDEPWKDGHNPQGSENHFGLFTLDGQAKYAIWNWVDEGRFEGLTRGGNPIVKSFKGDTTAVYNTLLAPPLKSEAKVVEITTASKTRKAGQPVTEDFYVILQNKVDVDKNATYPSATLKLAVWDGTCSIELLPEKNVLKVIAGSGPWWGCALELQGNGMGEDLSDFANGTLNFELRGTTTSTFELGFQTGAFAMGTQVKNGVSFGPKQSRKVKAHWQKFSIPVAELKKDTLLSDVTAVLYFYGEATADGKELELRNIFFSKK